MKIFLLPLVALLVLVAGASFAGDKHEPKLITAEELSAKIGKEKAFVVVDSRGGKWFDGEVIKGAVNLPADKTDAESLAKIAPTKDTTLVFYCTNVDCPASATSAHKALEAGYTNVLKFKGGIEEWKEKGLPTTKI